MTGLGIVLFTIIACTILIVIGKNGLEMNNSTGDYIGTASAIIFINFIIFIMFILIEVVMMFFMPAEQEIFQFEITKETESINMEEVINYKKQNDSEKAFLDTMNKVSVVIGEEKSEKVLVNVEVQKTKGVLFEGGYHSTNYEIILPSNYHFSY